MADTKNASADTQTAKAQLKDGAMSGLNIGMTLPDRLNAIRAAKAGYDWPALETELGQYKKDFGEDSFYLTYASDLAFAQRDFEKVKVINQRIIDESESNYWDLKKTGE